MNRARARARVTNLERMPNSINGNPRYRVSLDNGTTYATKPDAMAAYAITQGWVGADVEYTVDGNFHISHIERDDK